MEDVPPMPSALQPQLHMCIPPAGVSYRGLPFFELRSGDTFDVLREYGRPSTHPDLPLYVDDGEGGGRDVKARGEVGWALASFVVPLESFSVLGFGGRLFSPSLAFDIELNLQFRGDFVSGHA
jgi:hypothetical protein